MITHQHFNFFFFFGRARQQALMVMYIRVVLVGDPWLAFSLAGEGDPAWGVPARGGSA